MTHRGRNLASMALDLPKTMSPSKVSSFTDCPLAFRFAIIDRLPEVPTPHTVKGTLVHSALERLIWHHEPGDRSLAVALSELERAWDALQDDPELRELALGDEAAAAFLDDAETLVSNYFQLENPDEVRAVGVELGLEAEVEQLRLRGIIDRLDCNEAGELVVIDYKTGRSPSETFERARLHGVHLYALLCERVLGRAPAEVRLLYLRDPLTITAVPTTQSIRGERQRTVAVWRAIERACDREDFKPRPSWLCRSCSFRDRCPAVADDVTAQDLPSAIPIAS